MISTERHTPLVEYSTLPGSIHRFRLTDNTRAALDQLLEKLTQAAPNLQDWHGIARIQVIFESPGMPPLVYLFNRLKMIAHEIELPPVVYFAYVHHPDFIASLLTTFLEILPHRNQRYLRAFTMDHLNEASRWLQTAPEIDLNLHDG